MPVDSFLDAFLSRATIDKDGMPETTAAFASLDAVIKEKRAQRREPTEKDLYEPLVCPSNVFLCSHATLLLTLTSSRSMLSTARRAAPGFCLG